MICVGYTTVPSREVADKWAREWVEGRLAACVQVEGPITSHYMWQGQLETAQEFRLVAKFDSQHLQSLSEYVEDHSTYETPQWIVLEAAYVAPSYQAWIETL